MNIKPILACALISLVVLPPQAGLAGSLPEDTAVKFGSPEMDETVADAPAVTTAPNNGMPELDDSSVPEGTPPETFSMDLGGVAARPGEAPRINSFTIQTVSDIRFPSVSQPATVDATNPEGSTVISQYTLRVSVAELERQIGRTGYSDEQWKELSDQPNFDPEQSYITLAETKGIAPGSMVQQMTLCDLPDGSQLLAGDYSADMVVTGYDIATNKKSMIGSVVKVKFHILTDEITVVFTEQGVGQLRAFNPVTAKQVKYEILVSQKALVDGCGSPHRMAVDLEAQVANSIFDPEYEFITLYESEPVAPGEYLDKQVTLSLLPDGERLPKGEYVGFLTRYTYDAAIDVWQLLDAKTMMHLVVR